MRVLKNNLKFRDKESLKLIYNCYIKSRLFYCSQVWNQRCETARKTLRQVCNKVWALGTFGRPPEILTVNEQLFFNNIRFAKSIQSGNTLVSKFQIKFKDWDGRPEHVAKIKPRKRTKFIAKNEYSAKTATYWNWLPQEFRTSLDKPGFPKLVRALIIKAQSVPDARQRLPTLP